ncbi:TPA: transcriptional regulator [Mannheimia haemolytica]
MSKSIKRAVAILGGQSNLARACGVTQGAVQKWLNGGGISAEYLLKIEAATNGQVTIREICEELGNGINK